MPQRSLFKRFGYALSRTAVRVVGAVFFRFSWNGGEHIPTEGAVLVCSNHQSVFDPILVGAACDRRLNYLAKESLFRFMPLRWLCRFYDAIPIKREGLSLAGLRETLRRLKDGEMVLIFPEGTRTQDGKVAPLKPGFCALARRGRSSLLPMALDGAFDAWPRGQGLPRLTTIHIEYGLPLSPEEIKQLDDEQLVAEVERRIRACHKVASQMRNAG